MICIIDCKTSWLKEIKKLVKESSHKYKVIKLSEIKKFNFKLVSGVIISGSPLLLTKVNQKEYISLFRFIKNISVPVLGICLGHQIIGLLHGSKIDIGNMVNKKEKIVFYKMDKLFSGIKNNSFFQEEHSEFITVPKDFILLAKSKSCNNEAMRHKKKIIYGVQFHPEVSNGNGKKLFENFLNNCATH